jgi:Zn-finger nucleic acid-binding protein
MVEVERSEILVDACPECRGVWLDRGELDKILARERAAIAADPDEDFFAEVEGRKGRGEVAGRDRSDPRRKKKSRFGILEEFLDF